MTSVPEDGPPWVDLDRLEGPAERGDTILICGRPYRPVYEEPRLEWGVQYEDAVHWRYGPDETAARAEAARFPQHRQVVHRRVGPWQVDPP